MKKKFVGFRLDEDIHSWVLRAASKARIKKSEFIRRTLRAAFDQRHAK